MPKPESGHLQFEFMPTDVPSWLLSTIEGFRLRKRIKAEVQAGAREPEAEAKAQDVLAKAEPSAPPKPKPAVRAVHDAPPGPGDVNL